MRFASEQGEETANRFSDFALVGEGLRLGDDAQALDAVQALEVNLHLERQRFQRLLVALDVLAILDAVSVAFHGRSALT